MIAGEGEVGGPQVNDKREMAGPTPGQDAAN